MTTARERSRIVSSRRIAAGTTPRGRFADLDKDKLRGGYYTSSELAGLAVRLGNTVS